MRRLSPTSVNIETYAGCNAKCVMCPASSTTRKKGAISPALFEKLTDEIAELPDYCSDGEPIYGGLYVSLEGIGEPLLNKNIANCVSMLKQRRIRCVKLASNGSTLTEKRGAELIDAGLDFIELAVETTNKEIFESIRVGLDCDTVVGNILNFISLREARGAGPAIVLTIIVHSDLVDQLQDDVSFWSDHLKPNDIIRLAPRHNFARNHFAGTISEVGGSANACGVFDSTIDICFDGTVRLCCVDSEAEYVMGNADDEPLLDIFNNEKYQHIRAMHEAGRRSEMSLCAWCNLPECGSQIFRPQGA